ncbi:hypothetical protein C8Q74DRAFT_1205007 [Fomes fomentarius]|nr:hypothetical protein C8Q74DRAFT_1205007 [Fomes fomentarius]
MEFSEEDFKELLKPPTWLINHPVLKAQNMELTPPVPVFKPFNPDALIDHVVKITDPTSQEADIYDQLLRHAPASPNHTLPCQIIRSDVKSPVILMPYLQVLACSPLVDRDTATILDIFSQILEGVNYLHQAGIAHLDLSITNILICNEQDVVERYPSLELGKIYIIDFGESRQFELRPGRQPATDLPPSQIPKPANITRLDPYSWDMYCVGKVFETLASVVYSRRSQPQMLRRFVEWVIGNEQGCPSGVCHCRPTARSAREALLTLQAIVEG